jgi:hypothetical protein
MEDGTTSLKSLNIIPLPKSGSNPTLNRRAKIIARLEEQKLLLNDPTYTRSVRSWSKTDDGKKALVETKQRVLPWWSAQPNGSFVFFIRSGWKPIEFEKGKAAIVVPSLEKLPTIIDTLIAAVRNGYSLGRFSSSSSSLSGTENPAKKVSRRGQARERRKLGTWSKAMRSC